MSFLGEEIKSFNHKHGVCVIIRDNTVLRRSCVCGNHVRYWMETASDGAEGLTKEKKNDLIYYGGLNYIYIQGGINVFD